MRELLYETSDTVTKTCELCGNPIKLSEETLRHKERDGIDILCRRCSLRRNEEVRNKRREHGRIAWKYTILQYPGLMAMKDPAIGSGDVYCETDQITNGLFDHIVQTLKEAWGDVTVYGVPGRDLDTTMETLRWFLGGLGPAYHVIVKQRLAKLSIVTFDYGNAGLRLSAAGRHGAPDYFMLLDTPETRAILFEASN
jgi:hypothetical protein